MNGLQFIKSLFRSDTVKSAILVILLMSGPYSFAARKAKNGKIFLREVQTFIDSARDYYAIDSGRHSIYYVKLYSDSLKPNDFCFAMTYFSQMGRLDCIKINSILRLKNDIVVLDLNRFHSTKWYRKLHCRKISESDMEEIRQKLFSEDVSIMGHPRGFLFCMANGEIIVNRYRNIGRLPVAYALYDCPPFEYKKEKVFPKN